MEQLGNRILHHPGSPNDPIFCLPIVQPSPLNVPSLLKVNGIRPNKRLGQNFLVDESYLGQIVQASGVTGQDEVLEIGAGLGSLTRHLSAAAKQVIAVEIDTNLVRLLRQNTREFGNIEIVEADIFALKIGDYFDGPYSIVANIPYYLTSNLIRYLLEASPAPKKLALTVQEEVAERACASSPEMSLLALSVQLYGAPRIALRIPAGAFYPIPKVDSALLTVDLYSQTALSQDDIDAFFRMAKAAFAQKRKTLANSLAALPDWSKRSSLENLERAGIDPSRRPQTLSLAEWGKLLEVGR